MDSTAPAQYVPRYSVNTWMISSSFKLSSILNLAVLVLADPVTREAGTMDDRLGIRHPLVVTTQNCKTQFPLQPINSIQTDNLQVLSHFTGSFFYAFGCHLDHLAIPASALPLSFACPPLCALKPSVGPCGSSNAHDRPAHIAVDNVRYQSAGV